MSLAEFKEEDGLLEGILQKTIMSVRMTAISAQRGQAGVTLVELMIATVIFTIGILGLVAGFGLFQRSIQMSKDKTLSANLAQEKMQILEQQTYYTVLPTQVPSFLPDGTAYDTQFFPPEYLTEGGVNFARYTYVQVVTENPATHTLNILPPSTPDTGMRLLTVTLEWQEGINPKKMQVNSVFSNPNTVETNSIFTGTVKDSVTLAPLQSSLVTVAENVGWRDTTNVAGAYTINLMPGSYNLVASATGYFPQQNLQSVSANQTVNYPFLLTQMSSGAITGTPWMTPIQPFISQVVVSTKQYGNYVAQYIELYNPSQSAISMGNGVNIQVNFQNNPGCTQYSNCSGQMALIYNNNIIPPSGYYLIASTPTIMINGVNIQADAYYDNTNMWTGANCGVGGAPANWNPGGIPSQNAVMAWDYGLNRSHSGSLWIASSTNSILDTVGWWDNNAPPYCAGGAADCMVLGANGMLDGMQLVRASSPTWFDASGTYGRSYNSQMNNIDFSTFSHIIYQPYSSTPTFTTATTISGIPAIGAVVTSADGLSSAVQATSVGYPPTATFTLNHVATGTWMVLITSTTYELENPAVTIPNTGSIYNFPSSTTMLTGFATQAFIAGSVLDAFLNPITAPSVVQVSPGPAGSNSPASGTTGRYILSVTSGSVDVTANPSGAGQNLDYVTISSLAVSAYLGEINDGINFVLSQGGRATGWVTRDGVNALPGVTVTAVDANGYSAAQVVSDVNGNFQTLNVATGVYTVQPSLDPLSVSSPSYYTTTVTIGANVTVGTFTIIGALGTITGTVKSGGNAIKTGVLIVVTTTTLPAGPPPVVPTISSNTSGIAYFTSSQENGSYSIGVRQSTNPKYNVYGYYQILSSTTPVTHWTEITNVSVTAGVTTSGVNFAW